MGVLHHPPGGDDKCVCDHSFQTFRELKYPNSDILSGDLNRPDINRMLKHFHLKLLDNAPTKNDAILDLVIPT